MINRISEKFADKTARKVFIAVAAFVVVVGAVVVGGAATAAVVAVVVAVVVDIASNMVDAKAATAGVSLPLPLPPLLIRMCSTGNVSNINSNNILMLSF